MTTPPNPAHPSHADLMARADDLARLVRGRSREFEALCHLPPDVAFHILPAVPPTLSRNA